PEEFERLRRLRCGLFDWDETVPTFPKWGSVAWACRAATGLPTMRSRSPPSMPRSRPASPCSTPATSTVRGIAKAIKSGKRERAFIAVKFGAMRGPDLKFLGDDGRPNSVKNFLAYTLRRLGTDHVDLYQPARLDPTVPIEDTIGAIADMVKAGYVRH